MLEAVLAMIVKCYIRIIALFIICILIFVTSIFSYFWLSNLYVQLYIELIFKKKKKNRLSLGQGKRIVLEHM